MILNQVFVLYTFCVCCLMQVGREVATTWGAQSAGTQLSVKELQEDNPTSQKFHSEHEPWHTTAVNKT